MINTAHELEDVHHVEPLEDTKAPSAIVESRIATALDFERQREASTNSGANPLVPDVTAASDASEVVPSSKVDSSSWSDDSRRFSNSSSFITVGSHRDREKGAMARARKRVRQWIKEVIHGQSDMEILSAPVDFEAELPPSYFEALQELELMVEGVDVVFEVL